MWLVPYIHSNKHHYHTDSRGLGRHRGRADWRTLATWGKQTEDILISSSMGVGGERE